MTLPYVQITHDSGIEAKKETLSAEISLLNMSKSISDYRATRKLELSKKNALKR